MKITLCTHNIIYWPEEYGIRGHGMWDETYLGIMKNLRDNWRSDDSLLRQKSYRR